MRARFLPGGGGGGGGVDECPDMYSYSYRDMCLQLSAECRGTVRVRVVLVRTKHLQSLRRLVVASSTTDHETVEQSSATPKDICNFPTRNMYTVYCTSTLQ